MFESADEVKGAAVLFVPTNNSLPLARSRQGLVAYTADDMVTARTALACHSSQFTKEAMAQLSSLADAINKGTQYRARLVGRSASHRPVLTRSTRTQTHRRAARNLYS